MSSSFYPSEVWEVEAAKPLLHQLPESSPLTRWLRTGALIEVPEAPAPFDTILSNYNDNPINVRGLFTLIYEYGAASTHGKNNQINWNLVSISGRAGGELGDAPIDRIRTQINHHLTMSNMHPRQYPFADSRAFPRVPFRYANTVAILNVEEVAIDGVTSNIPVMYLPCEIDGKPALNRICYYPHPDVLHGGFELGKRVWRNDVITLSEFHQNEWNYLLSSLVGLNYMRLPDADPKTEPPSFQTRGLCVTTYSGKVAFCELPYSSSTSIPLKLGDIQMEHLPALHEYGTGGVADLGKGLTPQTVEDALKDGQMNLNQILERLHEGYKTLEFDERDFPTHVLTHFRNALNLIESGSNSLATWLDYASALSAGEHSHVIWWLGLLTLDDVDGILVEAKDRGYYTTNLDRLIANLRGEYRTLIRSTDKIFGSHRRNPEGASPGEVRELVVSTRKFLIANLVLATYMRRSKVPYEDVLHQLYREWLDPRSVRLMLGDTSDSETSSYIPYVRLRWRGLSESGSAEVKLLNSIRGRAADILRESFSQINQHRARTESYSDEQISRVVERIIGSPEFTKFTMDIACGNIGSKDIRGRIARSLDGVRYIVRSGSSPYDPLEFKNFIIKKRGIGIVDSGRELSVEQYIIRMICGMAWIIFLEEIDTETLSKKRPGKRLLQTPAAEEIERVISMVEAKNIKIVDTSVRKLGIPAQRRLTYKDLMEALVLLTEAE